MNELFSQGGKGSTGILTNKQAVARHFGVKQSEVVYFSVGAVLSGYKVIYDKVSQRAYSLPADIGSGVTAVSLSTAGVLVHSAGSVDLGALAVTREEYVTLPGSFATGVTINTKNELVVFTDGKYRWDGALPKTVPADSTPTSTGGFGPSAWVSVGDASLRSIAQYRANTIEDLKSLPFAVGDIVNVAGYYDVFDGSQHYRVISDTDDGTGVQLNNGLWANIIINGDACVDWFGAKGDGVADDWWAINKAINASISTAYQGGWWETSSRNPKFKVHLSRRSYRITRQILLPPYIEFYGMGSRWYFSGEDNSRLIPDFEDPMQFAVKSANYIVETGELAPEGWYSGVVWVDPKKLTACHGIKTYGYSIEPTKQILGGIRLIASPISHVYDIFITNVDFGVLLNCSWVSKVDVKTHHNKCGVMSSHDGNNTHVDGYFTGTEIKPLDGNPYLNPIESLDPTTGLQDKSISDPDSKIGVIFYWSQGSTSTNMTCEGNTISLAVAKGGADVRCLYSERNSYCTFTGYSSLVTIGEITGIGDGGTFELGVNNTISLDKDTQYGVAKRFKYVSEWGNKMFMPSSWKEYTKGCLVEGFDYSEIFVDAIKGDDTNVGSSLHPVKTLERALTLVNSVYTTSDLLSSMPRDRVIKLVGSATYYPDGQHRFVGGSLKITKADNSRPTVNLSKPIRFNDTSLVFEEVNLVRPTDDHGNNENGAIFLEDGSNEVRLKNCDLSLQKFSFLYPTWGFAGICTLVLNGVSVTGDSTTRMIQTADGNHDLHLFNVISYETTYTGGIESRPDKGYDIPADRRGHILGVSL